MLSNWSDETEKQFQEKINVDIREGYLVGTFAGMCLFPAFSIVDWFAHHEYFWQLTLVRGITTLVFFALHLSARKHIHILKPFASALFINGVAALSITILCLIMDGYKSPYYGGINLCILGMTVLFPWGPRRMMISTISSLVIYYGLLLIQADFYLDRPDIFINNSYFLLSTAFISIASANLWDRMQRLSFARLLEVERANKYKTNFFENVSHELRTPLSLILGPVEKLIKNSSKKPSEVSDLKLIDRNARILLKHVNDLLDISKIESGHMVLNVMNVNICDLVKHIATHFEGLASEREFHFKMTGPDSFYVQLDPEKIERVVMNLLSNAFKFTPPSGTIQITIEPKEFSVLISVSDSGPGIPENMQAAIFERFLQISGQQVHTNTGTGLGLSIVKEFIDLHLGKVLVKRSSLGGAEFIVEIPKLAPPGSLIGTGNTLHDHSLAGTLDLANQSPLFDSNQRQSKKPHLLLVEDNVDLSNFIAELLKTNYEVTMAHNGSEGFRLALDLKPDLIITDVMMPVMNGIEMIKELRLLPEVQLTPIIILTARADDQWRLKLLEMGAQDFILKPFSNAELILRVDHWVQNKRSKQLLQAELQTDKDNLEDLVLDVSQRNNQLKTALEIIRKAHGEARESLQVRDDFISVASHELTTPLTALKFQINMANRKLNDPNLNEDGMTKMRDLLRRSENQVNKMVTLIDDMLDLTRIRSGKFKIQRTRVELNTVVKEIIERFQEEMGAAQIEISFEPGAKIYGQWDPHRIDQVVTNLISNAFKYGDKKPIKISTKQKSASAIFEIKDHGRGIHQDHQHLIFERFERALSVDKVSGLGLGLYICKQIVEEHGGTISVKSQIDNGSTFYVQLPCEEARQSLEALSL